jgi:uncharacterized protein (TIGR02266 family)
MAPATLIAVKTVLVADDTAFVRDRFRTALEEAGHRTVTVQSGPELVAALRTANPGFDLIVLDLRLPQANGTEILKALGRIDAPRPPVLIFSGTIASADEVRALSAFGVAGYVNEYTAVQHILPALAPHLFPDQYNRRSSPRVVLGIPVAYRFGNTIATSVTLNISPGGVAVRTTSPQQVGSVVKARFRLPGGKKDIDTEARVCWTDRRVGMGLQFTKMDPAQQSAIDEFVQSHFFSNRKA